REQEARRRIELPIEFIKRPRTISKKQRIQGALRSPLTLGRLKFSTALSADYTERVKMELSGFPTSKHDDLLDTLEMIVTASSNMAAYDSERTRLRALIAEEHESLRAETEAYAAWLTGQDWSNTDLELANPTPYGF